MDQPLKCSICKKEQPETEYSSFYIWSEAKQEMIKYHRGECRPCFAARAYMKKNKAFSTKLSEEEQKNLRLVWRAVRTGTSLAAVHRMSEIKMAYPTFLKYVRSGEVEKWFTGEVEA